MTEPIETLRPEVREAVHAIDHGNGVFVDSDDGIGAEKWRIIRAELLRLASLEKQLRDAYAKQHEALQGWVQRATDAEAELAEAQNTIAAQQGTMGALKRKLALAEGELAALKARIAEAPVVACPKTLVHAGNTMQTEFLEYTHERMPGGCNSWAGKRVRLVVEK